MNGTHEFYEYLVRLGKFKSGFFSSRKTTTTVENNNSKKPELAKSNLEQFWVSFIFLC